MNASLSTSLRSLPGAHLRLGLAAQFGRRHPRGERHGKTLTVEIYDGAGHAFMPSVTESGPLTPKHLMVTVLIISGTRLYREGLAEMLACHGRLEVAGATRSIDTALSQLETIEPDAALLDVSVPGSTSAIRAITLSGRAVKIAALGVSETRSEMVGVRETPDHYQRGVRHEDTHRADLVLSRGGLHVHQYAHSE